MCCALAVSFLTARAQETDKETKKEKKAREAAVFKDLLENKQFTFTAQQAYPMAGSARDIASIPGLNRGGFPFNGVAWQLNGAYDVVVKQDTVICYLPYFGRAFVAPYGSSDTGIKFTSKDFDYSIKPQRKDGWYVTIKPNDVQGMQSLQFAVSSSGYTTLQVIDNNRQTISFNGVVEKNKMPKEKKN